MIGTRTHTHARTHARSRPSQVKWPGRPPNEAVKKEMTDTVQQMSNFRIHPVLQERLVQQSGQKRNFYGGNGYFKTSTTDLQAKTVTA